LQLVQQSYNFGPDHREDKNTGIHPAAPILM